MKYPYTGVILAGGLSTRLSGRNKAFIEVGGEKIIDRTYNLFSQLFEEIILVTNNPGVYLDWDLQIVSDIYQVRSSMTGLHAGLAYASNPFIFAVACDSPFLNKDLIEKVLSYVDDGTQVVVPEVTLGFEPLFAAYSKSCLEAFENCLNQERFQIMQIFRKKRIKKIPEHVLRKIDPDLLSFYNINTPEHIKKAEEIGKILKNGE